MNPSCVFYNKSFLEDLYPYSISFKDNKFNINFDINDRTVTEELKFFFNPDTSALSTDFWSPIFIDYNESQNFISNNLLAVGFSIDSSDLGIENVLSFKPFFKNWKCSEKATMSTDWILTPPAYSYKAHQGLMCWAKKKTTAAANNRQLTVHEIPYNSYVYPVRSWSYDIEVGNKTVSMRIDPDTKLIKKGKDIFLIVNNKSPIIKTADGEIRPSTQPQYFVLSDLLSYLQAKNILYTTTVTDNEGRVTSIRRNFQKEDIFFSYKTTNNDVIYFVSDGEVYSYYESEDAENIARSLRMPPKTYISPALHNIYRQIYHNLTLTQIKDFDNNKVPKPPFDRKQGRLIKELAGYLSTYPQIDRTTISVLQHPDVQDIVHKYIYNDPAITGKNINIIDVLIQISKYFKNVNIDETEYDNPTYLPKKLIAKYGSKLQLKGTDAFLKYNNELSNGPHLKVSSDIRSLAKNTIKNSFLYSSIDLQVGPFKAKTRLGPTESSLELTSSLSDKKNIIPLWDVKKTTIDANAAPFTVGADIVKDFAGDEISINLDEAKLLFEKKDSILAAVEIEFNWTQIFGPNCLRFSNRTLTSIKNNGLFAGGDDSFRFESSQDESPTVYIKRPGKYIIQCAITTVFGVKTQTLNLYINGPGYARPRTEIPRLGKTIDLLPDNKNIIMCHGMKEFVFGKQGIFWPVYSDLSVLEPRYTVTASPLAGLEVKRRIGEEVKPLGSVLNKFLFLYNRNDDTKSKINTTKAYFSMQFTQSEEVITEISHIILSHLNSDLTPYCEPIYRETFDNTLSDLELDSTRRFVDPISMKDIEVARPDKIGISKIAIESKDSNIVTKAMFNDEKQNLKFNEYDYIKEIYAADAENFSNKTNPVICYEQYSNNEEINQSQTIKAKKGYFHPHSGWIPQTALDRKDSNKTSIMIGDGSKRYCKTFKGLGFSELTNTFLDNQIKVYSSSITLNMDMNTAADPYGDKKKPEEFEKIEPNDHQFNYGYRDLSGRIKSTYKYTDEFIVNPTVSPDAPVSNTQYCLSRTDSNVSDQNFIFGEQCQISYTYPKAGPIMAAETLPRKTRYDRGFGRSIGDLEIKLNFLNYINPKELVVWLTIDPPSSPTASKTIDRKAISYKNNIDKIQNDDIKEYMHSIFRLNSKLNPLPPTEKDLDSKSDASYTIGTYYLYLLNQDHINMSLYNNIIKFTDHAVSNNNNLNLSDFITDNTDSAMLKNGILELKPTLAASGYNDLGINQYKAIIDANNLRESTYANFNKFAGMSLFEGQNSAAFPANNSQTTFTLHVAILGETDDGAVYDRIVYTDNVLNINNVKTKNISNILTNSLCSWEIILHNDNSLLSFEDKDAWGQINYKTQKPAYDGYNFIGQISNKIIPPINKDAPNKSILDLYKCFYNRERLTAPRLLAVPTLNLTPIIYIPTGTLVGELANISAMGTMMNVQAREFYNFFNDLRRVRLAETFNREIYIPKFTNYPTGRSEKSLINISKDKKVWYKLEAGILRYNNCPIIKKNRYKYQKIHYLNDFREFAKFPLNTVQSLEDLIKHKIKTIKTITVDKLFDRSEFLLSYNLSQEDILENISNSKSDTLLNLVKKRIELASDNIEIIKKNNNIDNNTLAGLQSVLQKYQELYKELGPRGIQNDDILMIESLDMDDSITNRDPYTVKLKNNTINLIKCIYFMTLLQHNKSLFIQNNLLDMRLSSLFPISSPVGLSATAKVKGDIIFVEGKRAYYTYKTSQKVSIFYPSILTDSDRGALVSLNQLLSEAETQLSSELAKLPSTNRDSTIAELKQTINFYKNKIFLLTHTIQSNTILQKSMIEVDGKYKTIFIFDEPVNKDAILVITPEDNRIITWDADHIGKIKNDETNIPNPWSFVNDSVNVSNSITLSDQNTFTRGMYGTGTIGNRIISLYSPEIVNSIKNFISYIDSNKDTSGFIENVSLIQDKQNINTTIQQIFTWDLDDTQSIINKYKNILKLKSKNRLGEEFDDILSTLDSVADQPIYNAYIKPYNLKFLVEGNIDTTKLSIDVANETGYIEFENSYRSELVYGLKDSNSSKLKQLIDLINTIPDKISARQSDITELKKKLAASQTDQQRQFISDSIKFINNLINKLHITYNKGLFYLNKFQIQSLSQDSDKNILPNIYVDFDTDVLDIVRFFEYPNDDYYIINIDAEQGCSLDIDKLPKILVNIEYECLSVVGPWYVDPFRFCYSVGGSDVVVGDYSLKTFGDRNRSIYTLLPNKLEKLKQQYAHPDLDWNSVETRSSDRSFFLNGLDSKGGIVKARYTYLCPKHIPSKNDEGPQEGNLGNKVKTIYNLDNINELYIEFKKINRNLRGVDNLYEKYIPTVDGFLVKSLLPSPGGPIDNTFKIWECYHNRDRSKATLPDNFKWMNLMKYMSFYNKYLFDNADQLFDINGGMDLLKTRDEIGLIPYDYK